MNKVKIAKEDHEILACWEAVYALRPHLIKEEFLEKIRDIQKENYHLAYIASEGKVVSIAGFRYMHMLYSGKSIYIDDLSTLETHRGKGYASQLLNYIDALVKEQKLEVVHLDSGFSRQKAHKVYFNHGYTISSFHFAKKL